VTVAALDPRILFSVDRPEVKLAIWDCNATAYYRMRDLHRLMADAPFAAIAAGRLHQIADLLSEQLSVPLNEELRADVADLAGAFAILDDNSRFVRVRPEALTHRGCHRWHADAVGLRLLCTYYGPGTEWLPVEGGATAPRTFPDDARSCAPAQVATGSVAVMKGERYFGNSGNGCIHRSPPAGRGTKARLLLCIDQTRWTLPDDS
jgi:hypothetical protein